MTEEPIRHVMTNPHFVRIVSIISHAWHSPTWQRRHPDIDLKTHLDALQHLLQQGVFTETAYRQTFPMRLLSLLDTLATADARLASEPADRAWLLQTMRAPRALTVMLVLMTTVYCPPVYYTPEQLAALGTASEEEWQRKAGSIPGAFQVTGRWFFPAIGLRAMGIAVDWQSEQRITDPDAEETHEADGT